MTVAEAWIVQRDTNGIRVIDENGLAVCVQCSTEDADLIASAPRRAEQVRILREALAGITRWMSEDDYHPKLVQADFDKDLASARAALEATKEAE